MTVGSLPPRCILIRSGSSSDAAIIIGIANSIITAGFKTEETIVSRDLPVGTSGELGTCRLGDGVKRRALACKLVPLGFIYVLNLKCEIFSQGVVGDF